MAKSKFAGNLLAAAAAVLFFAVSCSGVRNNDGILEIRDRLFITQITHIHLNADDYLGRTIKLEGIFTVDLWLGQLYFFVFRRTPDGCCGAEGKIGFEVAWPADQKQPFPEHGSWVEAVGVLSYLMENGFRLLYLELISLTELAVRGIEVVWN